MVVLSCYQRCWSCGLIALKPFLESFSVGIFLLLLSPSISTLMCWGVSLHPLCEEKAKMICMMTTAGAGALLWLVYELLYCPRPRKTERFQSCVPSSCVVFIMQLAWTMKQSWPWNKTRLCVGVCALTSQPLTLRSPLQKHVAFRYGVFPLIYFFFELYLLKKDEISLVTNEYFLIRYFI